jgi:hypothetical protein
MRLRRCRAQPGVKPRLRASSPFGQSRHAFADSQNLLSAVRSGRAPHRFRLRPMRAPVLVISTTLLQFQAFLGAVSPVDEPAAERD